MMHGYLTVYLTLIMTTILSLCLTLIEGVRANGIRVETECVAEIAFNSVLAEYHRELFRQYNLFALDASYGTSESGMELLLQHLEEYMERNFEMEDIFLKNLLYKDFLAIRVEEVEMTKVSFLTDDKGAVFRKCAIEAIQNDCNLNLLQDLQQWLQVVEDHGLQHRDVASEKSRVDEELEAFGGEIIQISETEWDVIKMENPTAALEKIRSEGILKYVLKNSESLSRKTVAKDSLIGTRMNEGKSNQGNMDLEEQSGLEGLTERFFFQEYLLRYLGHYGEEEQGDALSYQMEYLLMGKDNDIENLKNTANLLLAIREAANTLYIFADKEKCAEAEAVAVLTTTLLGIPEASTVLKNVMLLGWAFGESLYDVKTLLAGGRIPLMKNKETWHLDMQSALQYGGGETSPDTIKGLSYEDYLRIFMAFMDLELLTQRAMDMVEADIRLTPGNRFFRLDHCCEQMVFRIGVGSKYGYQYELTRKKGY